MPPQNSTSIHGLHRYVSSSLPRTDNIDRINKKERSPQLVKGAGVVVVVVRGKGVEVVKGRWWREAGGDGRDRVGEGVGGVGGGGWGWRGAQPACRRHGRDLFPAMNNIYHQICNRILRSLMPWSQTNFAIRISVVALFATAISLQSCYKFKINLKKIFVSAFPLQNCSKFYKIKILFVTSFSLQNCFKI